MKLAGKSVLPATLLLGTQLILEPGPRDQACPGGTREGRGPESFLSFLRAAEFLQGHERPSVPGTHPVPFPCSAVQLLRQVAAAVSPLPQRKPGSVL